MTPNAQSTKKGGAQNQSSDLFELNSWFSELQLCDLDRAEMGNGSKAESVPKCKILIYSSISTPCAPLASQATLVYCWGRLKGDSVIVYKYLKREGVSGC